MSLVGFGVKNLRCLDDTGIVPLKPITLLVGTNSSGKSTFLRAFPLLRQSVENARQSPILWEHPEYVDFGNIELAINDRAPERSVTFAFSMESSDQAQPWRLDMTVAPSASGPYLAEYVLQQDGTEARLRFDPAHKLVSYVCGGYPAPMEGYWLGETGYLVAPIDDGSQGRLIYQSYTGGLRRGGIAGRRWIGGVPAARGGSSDPRVPRAWTAAEIVEKLGAADLEIAHFMHGVAYLGPQRAVADRLYRLRDVAVEEVRSDGENLANFLASLSPGELTSFAAFTAKHLGFRTSVRTDKLSVEILVEQKRGDSPRNIADVGFGYAEVLPLCTVLWSSCVREPSTKRRRTSLVALEQPELHLHPAHQARLPHMIVDALKESRKAGREVKFMVETHSEGIINELGMMIRRQRLDHEDAQILFFDQDPHTRETSVVRTGYEADGVLLENWPFGFLAGVVEPLEDLPDAAEE